MYQTLETGANKIISDCLNMHNKILWYYLIEFLINLEGISST